MYNIYTEEKKKRELENKQKEEQRKLKYREKFQSKRIYNINIILI